MYICIQGRNREYGDTKHESYITEFKKKKRNKIRKIEKKNCDKISKIQIIK